MSESADAPASDVPGAPQAASADNTALAALQAQRQTLQAQLETAQAQLPALEAEKAAAQSAYEEACRQFETVKQEVLDGLQASTEAAQRSYDTAVQSYNAVALQTEQQLAGYAANVQKAQATANTATGQLELQHLREGLEDYIITAPCGGTLTALRIQTGDVVSNGMTVATIADLNTMEIAIRVDEYAILQVGAGHPVTIYIDAIDKSYAGTITEVASTATIENGVSFYQATVSFTADEAVKAGMSVEVRLTNVDEKDALAIPADALRYYDDNTAYVLVPDADGRPSEQRVTVGASDGAYVQILEGLQAGDAVLLAKQDDFALPGRRLLMGGAQ